MLCKQLRHPTKSMWCSRRMSQTPECQHQYVEKQGHQTAAHTSLERNNHFQSQCHWHTRCIGQKSWGHRSQALNEMNRSDALGTEGANKQLESWWRRQGSKSKGEKPKPGLSLKWVLKTQTRKRNWRLSLQCLAEVHWLEGDAQCHWHIYLQRWRSR
jgi:hypothetical protein